MQVPRPRGQWSAAVRAAMTASPAARADALAEAVPPQDVWSADAQLGLWMLYELHYRGFDDVDPDAEWDPALLAARRPVESEFESALRGATRRQEADALAAAEDVPGQVTAVIDASPSIPVAAYLQREATEDQFLDFLRRRSVYHLKESDPHSFVLPRLGGATKAALAELQYDEYGAGRPDAVHSVLFARALASVGLDARYGAHVDTTDETTLAVNNVMSLFGLHRRLRGAAMGHLAAFEATSSAPCRRIAGGARRLGLPEPVVEYFDEHVEADAVHEQLAIRAICSRLVDAEPELREDVLFGVAACLHLDVVAGERLMADWKADNAGEVAS